MTLQFMADSGRLHHRSRACRSASQPVQWAGVGQL